MSYRPDSANDQSDAYALISTPAELRGPPVDRCTVTRNGVPVWHFPPNARDRADRFRRVPSAAREQEEGA